MFIEIICSIFKNYSGTPLIRSPVGPKNGRTSNGVAYYRDRVKFHDLSAVMKNTSYMAFGLVVQLCSL